MGQVGRLGAAVTATAVPPDTTAADAPGAHAPEVEEHWLQRRISLIWLLLMLNVMPWIGGSLLPVPRQASQGLTAGALGLALVLALCLNRRLIIRPNFVLALFTALALAALMTSLRGDAGVGAVMRSFRLCAFLAVLWLLTPWWGRHDFLLLKAHLRALILVLAVVLAGVLVAPSAALSASGRLTGVLWPVPAPQVGQYAAVVAGVTIVLWLSGSVPRRTALFLGGLGVLMVVLSHTRTALIALLLGVACAGSTLLLTRRRARLLAVTTLVLAPILVAALAPALVSWFFRDQTTEEISGLTGRKNVWEMVLGEPRSAFTQVFGRGLSNKSYAGLAIDSSWLAAFHDQGLFGTAVMAALLLFLLIVLALQEAGPARAVATFLVVYCAVASYTEVGFGDASPYLLHLVVAASLTMAVLPSWSLRVGRERPTPALSTIVPMRRPPSASAGLGSVTPPLR